MKRITCLLLALASFSVYAQTKIQCGDVKSQSKYGLSVMWDRDSAEKNALYHQGYNVATQYVENWVKTNNPTPKTWGIVLDIDDTVLDNSWFMHYCGAFPNTDVEFGRLVANAKRSTAEPGVVEFLNKVHSLGGYVSLISNRDGNVDDETGNVLASTVANLKAQKVYFDQVVIANFENNKTPYDKDPRFKAVISGNYDTKLMVFSNKLPAHQVIAYFGDNIQDFPKFKQKEMIEENINSSEYSKFGNKYFVFPNPMYGSWTSNKDN
jgi:5'-nucleotidase (lipoprotein e(P4) family)